MWGRGKGSRVPVEAPNAIVVDFRGEKVWRIHSYFDQAEALEYVALETMYGENVEVVLRWLLAFGSDRDAFGAVTHPEIEWMPFEEGHIPSHGLDRPAAQRSMARRVGAKHQDRGDLGRSDHVFLAATVVGRGRASGAEVEIRFYGHCRVRDDKVSYCYEHLNRDEALIAVGIEG